jgi:hypothetical protein
LYPSLSYIIQFANRNNTELKSVIEMLAACFVLFLSIGYDFYGRHFSFTQIDNDDDKKNERYISIGYILFFTLTIATLFCILFIYIATEEGLHIMQCVLKFVPVSFIFPFIISVKELIKRYKNRNNTYISRVKIM